MHQDAVEQQAYILQAFMVRKHWNLIQNALFNSSQHIFFRNLFAGFVDVVSVLVRNGANVNARMSNNIRPLHLASINGML